MRDLAETRASSATGGALILPRESSTALGDDFRLPLWTKTGSDPGAPSYAEPPASAPLMAGEGTREPLPPWPLAPRLIGARVHAK
jgi:hypothetical protein